MNDSIEGMAREIGGRAERTVGELTGDAKMQADGLYQQAAGSAQRAWGQAQEATGQARGAIRAQPLVATAIAVGVGYLLGRLSG